MVVGPACDRAAGRRPEGTGGQSRHRRRRGRAGDRRLRDPVRGAVQQHQPGGVADRGFARTCRRHHRGLPVRQRPAGQPPDRRPDRRRRHRHRHRVRHRGDEPRRAGRQRGSGPGGHPRGVLGYRHAQPVRGRRTDRQAAWHHPRGHRRVRAGFPAEGQAGLGRGPVRPGDQSDRGAGAGRAEAADERAGLRHPRSGPARHHVGGPGFAEPGPRGRHPHRGHVIADFRRRGRGAVDGRRQSARRWA